MRYLFTALSMCMVLGNLQGAHTSDPKANTVSDVVVLNPFVIYPEDVQRITQAYGISAEVLLQRLIPLAKSFARPPISNYRVGVAALGKSGTIYLGVNLEFPGVPLNETVHGEQFLIANARSHGEAAFTAFAISAAPCGHCRQFLNEMCENEDMKILIPDGAPETISSLLPHSFGKQDLGSSGSDQNTTNDFATVVETSVLMNKAIQAAHGSYAPHTQSYSGVAIQTKDGQIYCGSYIENAAYNPSLPPLQSACVALVAGLIDYSEIHKVILAEQSSAKISHEIMSREILKQIAPEAEFSVVKYDSVH